jgi:CBS domain-containing protein
MIQLAEIMTKNPITLGKFSNVNRARKLMAEHHIRHLPILDTENGQLLGVVSQKALLKNAIKIINDRGLDQLEHIEKSMSIETVMESDVPICTEDTPILEAAKQLKDNKGGCVLISEQDRLVGILTSSDFVDYAIQSLS